MKKRMLSLCLCVVLVISAMSQLTASAKTVVGDVNGDGSLTSADVRSAIAYIASASEENNAKHADFNGDGAANLTDIRLIIKAISENASLSVNPSMKDLAFNLLKNSYKKGENTAINVISAANIISMMADGASDETAYQFKKILGLADDENIYDMLDRYSSKDGFKFSNSVFIRDGFNVNPTYMDNLTNNYNAIINQNEDFGDNTAKKYSDWLSEKTDGLITGSVPLFNANDSMMLANASCFKSAWSNPFSDELTEDGTFVSSTGESQETKMLVEKGGIQIPGNSTAYIFSKSYQGGKYYFTAIMPRKTEDLKTYIDSLTPSMIYRLTNKKLVRTATVKIPAFNISDNVDLNDTMSKMGVNSESFGNISVDSVGVRSATQKTVFSIDEKGTASASESQAIIAIGNPDDTVVFNRPFIYMVCDRENDTPLIIGTVDSVK